MRGPTDVIRTLEEIAGDLRAIGNDAVDEAVEELERLPRRLDGYVRRDEVVAMVEAAAEGFEREQAVEQAEEDFRAANFAFQKARAMKDLAAQLKGQA